MKNLDVTWQHHLFKKMFIYTCLCCCSMIFGEIWLSNFLGFGRQGLPTPICASFGLAAIRPASGLQVRSKLHRWSFSRALKMIWVLSTKKSTKECSEWLNFNSLNQLVSWTILRFEMVDSGSWKNAVMLPSTLSRVKEMLWIALTRAETTLFHPVFRWFRNLGILSSLPNLCFRELFNAVFQIFGGNCQ